MAVQSGSSVCLLLLLLSPLIQAQDDCTTDGHCLPNWLNGTYYIRPEGSENASCPAQPCLTPSQLRDDFFACGRYNSCQISNTSLVLLPGIYSIGSNHGSFFPPTNYFSLTGYDENCNNSTLPTAIIDCSGTWISLTFQHIKCVQVYNCVVFTGHDTSVVLDRIVFHDTLIRMASIIVDDFSDLDYNYTTGSLGYCLLQKQLADSYISIPSNSTLELRNISFSSDYHSTCARNYGILLSTIYAFDSVVDIADCTFSQNAVNHISLHNSTLHISGSVQFENANTAIQAESSTIDLAGTVKFINNEHSAIRAIDTYSTIILAGTVKFIGNRASKGGGIYSDGSLTIADNAQVVFQGNHADYEGGAIISSQDLTLEGTVRFISNSAYQGGAIFSTGNVTVADNARMIFQGNKAVIKGGAIISYHHVTLAGTVNFINNTAAEGGAVFSKGNVTVAVQGNRADHTDSAIFSAQNATIEGTVKLNFINNSAYSGGAVYSNGNVTIADNSQVSFQGNSADFAGGAIFSVQHVALGGTVEFSNNICASTGGAVYSNYGSVTIANNAHVVFQGNHAGSEGGAIVSLKHVTLEGTVKCINNSANQGGAIRCYNNVAIANNAQVFFQSNHADKVGGAIFCLNYTLAKNAQVTFQGNDAQYGGGIFFLEYLNLTGTVKFINNTALKGGAIYIQYDSHMAIANHAHVIFQGNHADHVGGAICSPGSDISQFLLIGFHDPFCRISSGFNSTIEFIDNTAKSGGSAMYGITVSKLLCDIIDLHNNGYENLFDAFTFIPDNLSAVSSDPLRVCICPDQSTPDCLAILPEKNIPSLHYTVYPGQNFTIPAAVVGFNFALTSGSLHTQFLNSDASLGSASQYVQGVSHTGCSQLQYSILSDKKQETIVLTSNGRRVGSTPNGIEEAIRKQNENRIYWYRNQHKYYVNNIFVTNLTDGVFRMAGYVDRLLQDTPVFISLTLLDCPPGFTLSGKPHSCDCNERVLTNHLTCNITDQTVHRHSTIWVNASFVGNTIKGVIIHKHCPFEYCKPEQVDVDLTHPEIQCAFDHYGTLCGACKPGFSLALGSSQCLSHCSKKYLSLLIPFVLASFALLFLIKILNLTVSQGTMNGLIFYANIVAANQSIFFPSQYNKVLSFLSVFISWLNLDLGFETCFIKGLDGYWKTWLQLVFPFYVWAIAGAIILASHYSTRATKIFGDNSVSVLATLFLLSYAKLLRSIITILSFTTLVHPDNSTTEVWAYDGNIQYLSQKHIPLFLFAFAIVLLLWLPYTAVLLSAQWLRTQTHHKGLRWLKPFLDAYYGPFKDKHHYWVGILLVVRGVLFIFFASFFAIENNVNLLLILVSSVSVLMYASITGRLYKRIYLSILENSFFLNLAVLAAGTYHIRLVGGSQEALVTTSVGIAFVQFIGITAFHSYQFVIVPIGKKCRDYAKSIRAKHRARLVELEPLLNSDSSDSNSDDDEDRPRNVVTHSEVRLSELREEAAQLPLNPTSAEHQLPPSKANQVQITAEILIPFDQDTPRANNNPLKMQTDTAANEAAGGPKKPEAAAMPLDEPPPPQESNEPPRYFAATREERFIDFNAPRESLLEFTQYHLPEERNEPPRYFAAEREGFIDFTAPRESLLEYTQ